MELCIFEDERCNHLNPLTLFRPAYDLRCGITTLREKILRTFHDMDVTLLCRQYLEGVVKEENPDLPVNELRSDSYLFINGCVLADSNLRNSIDTREEGLYFAGERVAAAVVDADRLERIKSRLGRPLGVDAFQEMPSKELKTTILEFPWDFVHRNAEQIGVDFDAQGFGARIDGRVFDGVHMINRSGICIAEGSVVKPGAVLDAEDGPILIDREAEVMPQATIIGPAYIGYKTKVKIGAKIYEGTSVGEYCKVGGEMEESIIHSYSNKQHDGFLGHAYVGQWVNIGADTNNSDLKNNYSSIKVVVNGKLTDTGSMFVGATMGDHAKTGINTMLNTGSVLGGFSNVYGGGFPPKYIPSFCWGGKEGFVEYRLDKALETASRMMNRRERSLTPGLESLYRKIFELTLEKRKQWLAEQE